MIEQMIRDFVFAIAVIPLQLIMVGIIMYTFNKLRLQ